MTTIQQVFDQAIHLMDEQSEANGTTLTADTNEYRYRTVSILNTVLPSLYPYSDTYEVPEAGRPVCPVLLVTDYKNPDFTQRIPVDDTLALGVLPYALAEHLLAGENEDLAAFFRSHYNQAFADLRNKIPQSFKPIHAPYGFF